MSPLEAFDILVQTLKLLWTWQVTSWSPFTDGSWLMGSPPMILTSGLLPYDLMAKLNLSPSWKEPWSSFPRLWGGRYLSSPRPGNGFLRHLRACHQLSEFLDSTSNPLSQRNWPMVSWVRNSWASRFLLLGRSTYIDHGDISAFPMEVLGITL